MTQLRGHRGGVSRREIRVVLYSHDSLGLGHLRRNLLIAGAIRRAELSVQTLLITGTGYANAFRIPDGVDVLSLPSLWKVDNGNYEPRRLHIECDDLTAFRTATAIARERERRVATLGLVRCARIHMPPRRAMPGHIGVR